MTRTLTVPLRPQARVIAVRPAQDAKTLSPSQQAAFDIVTANPDASLFALSGLEWELLSVQRDWQWYHFDGRWRFEPVERTRRIASGTLDTLAEGPARIAATVGWGTHRLVLKGEGGALETIHTFAVGHSAGAPDSPDTMEVSLDRDGVSPGETINVRVAPRFSGKVTVADHRRGRACHAHRRRRPRRRQRRLHRRAGLGNRCLCRRAGASPARHRGRPHAGRAIGLKWFPVGRADKTMTVQIDAPPKVRANTALNVPVRLVGLRRANAPT